MRTAIARLSPVLSARSSPSPPCEALQTIEPSQDPSDPAAALPAFLRQSPAAIEHKFVDLEWLQRIRSSQDRTVSESYANTLENADEVAQRNRYWNVEPFNTNRVRLVVPDGTNDYINASPIILETSRSKRLMRWIATQGPKETTTSHLWRMVQAECSPDNGSAVIVMLTMTHECGREKCFPYFPLRLSDPVMPLNGPDEFGDGWVASLRLLSCSEDPRTLSTIRLIELQSHNAVVDAKKTPARPLSTLPAPKPVKIWHHLFHAWPDFVVPEGEDRYALVRLIYLARAKSAERASPIRENSAPPHDNPRIIHCSAGIGRTGTYIALDYLLTELEEGALDRVPDDVDPIFDTVSRLRLQRTRMVQGHAQYSFLYSVLRDRWLERRKEQMAKSQGASSTSTPTAVPAAPIPDHFANGNGNVLTAATSKTCGHSPRLSLPSANPITNNSIVSSAYNNSYSDSILSINKKGSIPVTSHRHNGMNSANSTFNSKNCINKNTFTTFAASKPDPSSTTILNLAPPPSKFSSSSSTGTTGNNADPAKPALQGF